MAKAHMKVVVADYDYGNVDIEREIVEGAGMELVAAQCKTEGDVIAAARDADAILNQYAKVGAKAITALPELKVISRFGTGVDIVDVDAATRSGIQVTNAPNDWCADEVADHAVALLMSLVRKIHVYARETRQGVWHWQSGRPIYRIRGSVLGLLSFGAIAQRIATSASARGTGTRNRSCSSTASVMNPSARTIPRSLNSPMTQSSPMISRSVPQTPTSVGDSNTSAVSRSARLGAIDEVDLAVLRRENNCAHVRA